MGLYVIENITTINGKKYIQVPDEVCQRLIGDHRALWLGDGPDYTITFRDKNNKIFIIRDNRSVEEL